MKVLIECIDRNGCWQAATVRSKKKAIELLKTFHPQVRINWARKDRVIVSWEYVKEETMSKLGETHKQIDKMLEYTRETLYQMVKAALASGALSDEMKREGNWLLTKAVMDIWCQERQYRALDRSTKKESNNLSHFI